MAPMIEEEQYQVYDNVRSLTLECGRDLTGTSHNNHQFFFRKLTELQVFRTRENPRSTGPVLSFTTVLSKLLSSNRESLVRFKMDHLFQVEFELLSAHFDQLETLEYGLLLLASGHGISTEFLSYKMSKWGPNLRQLNYQVETTRYFRNFYAPEPIWDTESDLCDRGRPTNEIHIDYSDLRTQVLSHPNLEFNCVQLIFADPQSTERRLFGSTFQESRDSKYFGFTDFCESPDRNLFQTEYDYRQGGYPDPVPLFPVNFFMDFAKLRVLIRKAAELEEPEEVNEEEPTD